MAGAALLAALESSLATSLTTIPLLAGQDELYLGAAVPANVSIPELEWFDELTP